MKKSNIFMAAGAFVLAISGVLATKASKKFAAVTQANFSIAGSYTASGSFSLPSGHFTTVSNAHQVFAMIYTNAGGTPTVLAAAPLKTVSIGSSSVFAY